MEPVLDFHTHAQNVYGMCCVPPALRPLMRTGLGRLYEKTGFSPTVKKAESPVSMQFVVREMQSRFEGITLEKFRAAMQTNGVTHACALPVEPMATTRNLLELVRGAPEIIPFASVDFEKPDPAQQLRPHLAAGCRGVKIHPIMQHVAPEDERIRAVFETLRDHEVPALFHTGRMHYYLGRKPEDPAHADPERLIPLARAFPRQPIVLGHMGLLDADPAIRMAQQFPNVFLEISFQPAPVLRRALREVGPDRLLLGSDWPASETKTEIAIVRKVTTGDRKAERKILFENGARLLHLEEF